MNGLQGLMRVLKILLMPFFSSKKNCHGNTEKSAEKRGRRKFSKIEKRIILAANSTNDHK